MTRTTGTTRTKSTDDDTDDYDDQGLRSSLNMPTCGLEDTRRDAEAMRRLTFREYGPQGPRSHRFTRNFATSSAPSCRRELHRVLRGVQLTLLAPPKTNDFPFTQANQITNSGI